MKTARNCALVLTVFTCASGMRYVTDEDYSANVAANIGRILQHESVRHPERAGEITYPGIRVEQVPPQGWINTSLGREQRADPVLASLDRMLTRVPRAISPGFGDNIPGSSFGVNAYLTTTPGI